MLKKLSSILFGFAALVGATELKAEVREHLYVGAGIIESLNHFTLDTRNYTSGMAVDKDAHHNVLLANVFLGYGYTFKNCVYLGGELGANFIRRSATLTRPGVSVLGGTFIDHLRVRDYIVGDMLLGYRLIQDFLLYARVGISISELELDQPVMGAVPHFASSKNRVGGRFGVGINYGFTDCIGIGVDYCFSLYQNLETRWPLYTIDFKEKAYSHMIGLTLFYSFW